MTPKALLAPARLARQPVLRSQSDERLVDLVRAGSEPAFEVIVARYRGALLRYCRGILPESRAEDAVQQAFVSAFAAMRRDDAHLDLRPWLYRIAHNTALNVLRDRGLEHAELDEQIDGVERPDQALERSQGLRDVLGAVQALPARQRDAMVLRELEGRSYEEIALVLGVTDGAVRQLLNRARNSLRSAAAAVTPMALASRLASGDSAEPVAARVAEIVGVGSTGGGALMAKLCATALVTGAVVGGIAVAPNSGRDERRGAGVGAEAAEDRSEDADSGGAAPAPSGGRSDRAGARVDSDGSSVGARTALRDDDRSGRLEGGGGDDDARGDRDEGPDDERSGPGGGDDGAAQEPDDHSGPGGGGPGELEDELREEVATTDNSGPGGGGGGTEGPGSGDSIEMSGLEEPD